MLPCVPVKDTGNGLKITAVPRISYTMSEAAQALGISYKTMHRLIKRGLIRSSSALRTKLIPHFELERFLKSTLVEGIY